MFKWFFLLTALIGVCFVMTSKFPNMWIEGFFIGKTWFIPYASIVLMGLFSIGALKLRFGK